VAWMPEGKQSHAPGRRNRGGEKDAPGHSL
jgi:hypothetical protein